MRNLFKKLGVVVVGGVLLAVMLVTLFPDTTIAQDLDRLATKVTSTALGRLSDFSDVTYALNAAANDTTQPFVPAKWTSVQFVVAGTTPDVLAIIQCGNKFGGDVVWVNCDTLAAAAAGTFMKQINVPTAQRARIVLDGQVGSGADVTVDSLTIGRNW